MRFISLSNCRYLITVCLLWTGSLVPSHAELPELGDPTQQELSPFREYLMGKNFYRTLKANVPFVDDLEVNDYINTLGQKLVSYSSKPDKEFHFFVLKVDNINAFAGPDAYLGFHTGLIIAAENESELAGVMAHEISHVTQRHLARAMTESQTNPATIFATILAGILVASQNPDAGAALIYGGQAALIQSQINFTRTNEHEADRIGINVLKNAGINPEGMAGFFETLLEKAESNNIIAQMEYLRTHPLSTTRIAEARNRISEVDQQLPDDSLNFQLTRARVLVASAQNKQAIIQQITHMESSKRNSILNYTLALSYLENQQPKKAIAILEKLVKAEPHPWFKLALSDALVKLNQPKKAAVLLDELNTLYPNYLPVTIRYARLLISMKQSTKATTILNRLLRTQKTPVVYNTLAKAYFASGKVSLALEATSLEYEQEGYLKHAAQQINNALQQPDLKPTTVQRLEARKQELTLRIVRESNQ